MSVAEPGLAVAGLCKRYGRVQALKSVDLKVDAGERVALVGHNGAGKSTLMRLALGLGRPDDGSILVCGAPPGTPATRRQCGYLPESARFHTALTGAEQIRMYARLKGGSVREAMDCLTAVGLEEAAGRRVGGYSRGMRQRLGLAQALLGKPRLLVLDEPTGGLDPDSRRTFYQAVTERAEGGAAVLMSSHALDEVERHVDRVAVLRRGQLLVSGTMNALREQCNLPTLLRLHCLPGKAEEVAAALGGVEVHGGMVDIRCPAGAKMEWIRRAIAQGGWSVVDIEVFEPSLDELYRVLGDASS